MATGERHVRGAYLPHLQAWRMYRGYSLKDLSARTATKEGEKPIAYVSISRIEHGAYRAGWESITRLAAGLGIDRQRLMHEAPPSE